MFLTIIRFFSYLSPLFHFFFLFPVMSDLIAEPPKEFDYLFKLIVIGDRGSGKSCLILRYTDDTWTDKFISTIGVDFKIKTIKVDEFVVKLQIWDHYLDHCGRPVTRLRGAHGIPIVYDVTDEESFKDVRCWLGDVERYASENVLKVIVGNKSDLTDKRAVSYEEGKEIADKAGASFIEVSAKTGENVDTLFSNLARDLILQRLESEGQNTTLSNDNDEDKKKEGCFLQ